MPLLAVADPTALKSWVRETRQAGRRVALVPTMGYLHQGHLALVAAARTVADAVVMSIFVNPLQFGPREDLDRYPRDLPRDRDLAEQAGVDLLFVPEVSAMYPPGSETRVVPGETASRWEGAARPGHFAGVLTVVAKLFHLVEPAVAVFGQKDVQQAVLIRRMVRDLDWPLELLVVPTVREPDGLALSSRNVYLAPEERAQALGLSRALARAHQAWQSGERDPGAIRRAMDEVLGVYPGLSVEYIAVTDAERMAPVERADADTIVAVAGTVGRTRLIDNIVLGKGL